MANSILNLAALNGSNGFVLNGLEGGSLTGFSVSNAGDVNGDGRDDLIVGVRYGTPEAGLPASRPRAGQAYVIFGKVGSFGPRFDLSSLLPANGGDGRDGFVLNGMNRLAYAGHSVSSAGDINGDGLDDLIIGAPGYDFNSIEPQDRWCYVVFGRAGGWDPTFELSSLLPMNGGDGRNGFALTTSGQNEYDYLGGTVSNAGDVNGDGRDDLIINNAVIFGRDVATEGPFAASFTRAELNGSNGFLFNSEISAVSNAGDVNGDGLDDLIIGCTSPRESAGQSYVIFGQDSPFPASLGPEDLDGRNGFVLNGIDPSDLSGNSVSNAGDVNGDGIDDLLIGAVWAGPQGEHYVGQSYVVFGRTGGFEPTFELSSLLPANGGDGRYGFVLNGSSAGDYLGYAVSTAGDINGDGIDDLIIGAYGAPSNSSQGYIGQCYVVFGRNVARDGLFAANLDVEDLDGRNGFVINGIDQFDQAGFSVSNAGDINGDGLDDLVIGAPEADPEGLPFTGEAYVVYGNYAPKLDLNGGTRGINFTTTFTVGISTAPIVADDLSLIDYNSASLVGATVKITNPRNGAAESLLATTSGTSISSRYDPLTGTLSLSGSDSVEHYQQVLRSLTYQNTASSPDLTTRSIQFTVDDGAAHSNTSALATTTLLINTVNDPPINRVPEPQTTPPNTPLVFSSTNGNAIRIRDADAISEPVRVTLIATGGLISLGTTRNVAFTGDGKAEPAIVLWGSLKNINTALDGLRFKPTEAATIHGSASLSIFTNDLGHSGPGGAQTDHDTVKITIDQSDTRFGSESDDQIDGSEGKDIILGLGGNDELQGGDGKDLLAGGGGHDFINGGRGCDYLSGGTGRDRIVTGGGHDTVLGGLGNDRILLGGQGWHTVVVVRGHGSDTILNFQLGQTQIGLAGGLGIGDLSIAQTQNATLISAGSELLATLSQVSLSAQQLQDSFTIV